MSRREAFARQETNRLPKDSTNGFNTHTYNYSYDSNDNILTNNESGSIASSTYDVANRLVTTVDGTGTTTYTYDANGSLTAVASPSVTGNATMSYDKERRLSKHQASSITTYTYAADGKKRSEIVSGTATTLVWDGEDYLQSRP